MWRSKRNKSIPSLLHDRELNVKCAPYFLSLSVISQLLRSNNNSLYDNYFKMSSQRPMTYDCGYLYFSNYTQCCSIYGRKSEPTPMFEMQKSKASMKVSDVISYTIPIYTSIDDICKCGLQVCTCFSQYLLSISEDNWLCQHLMASGKIMKQIYVNRIGQKFRFKYCDWDVYGDRFVLTSTLNPDAPKNDNKKKSDVVVNLAIFSVFPIEFVALLEIKRSVFGENCTAANLSDQHLILGKGSFQVHIYNFEDFLKEGNLTPYKLGDDFEHSGNIGTYPTGLPLNFTYTKAPPVLFNVHCFGQIIRFGGYPYHYITSSTKNSNIFTVNKIEANVNNVGVSLMSSTYNDEIDALLFHPDHSNRLIFRTNQTIDCYKMSTENNVTNISKLFSMGFTPDNCEVPCTSIFGRKILKPTYSIGLPCSVFTTDYANDLDLFAILGVYHVDSTVGFVRLYDSITGEEVRTLQLKDKVCDHYFYQLFVDMGSIIIIERKTTTMHTVHVYHM